MPASPAATRRTAVSAAATSLRMTFDRASSGVLPGSPVFGNAGDDRQAGDEQHREGDEYRGLQLAG